MTEISITGFINQKILPKKKHVEYKNFFIHQSLMKRKRPIDYARPETLKDLSKISLYLEVDWGDSDVSKLPLVSFGYHHCNAIALLNGEKAGLCHIGPGGIDISSCLKDMIEDLEAQPKKLKAILVAGAGMKTMEKHCKNLGINVVDSYQDDWYYNYEYGMLFYPRDVLLLPSSREVIIYANKGNIPKLFDSCSKLA